MAEYPPGLQGTTPASNSAWQPRKTPRGRRMASAAMAVAGRRGVRAGVAWMTDWMGGRRGDRGG